jgi:hypothetical protein
MRSPNAATIEIGLHGHCISDGRTTKLSLNNGCNLLHSTVRRMIFRSTLCSAWMSATESLCMHVPHSHESSADDIMTRDEFHPVYTLLLMCGSQCKSSASFRTDRSRLSTSLLVIRFAICAQNPLTITSFVSSKVVLRIKTTKPRTFINHFIVLCRLANGCWPVIRKTKQMNGFS